MKNLLLSSLSVLFLVSCQNDKNKTFDVNLLNGYWEIEQVTMASGTTKEYKMSETIDFFEIESDSGFRKKVTPQVDGTYIVNDSEEKIKVETSDKGTYISYKTDYASWKEQIIALTKEQLILENEQHIQYQYKKPTPFTLK